MSLIRIRRVRKKNWLQERKGLPPGRLVAFFVMTVALIWYLGWRF